MKIYLIRVTALLLSRIVIQINCFSVIIAIMCILMLTLGLADFRLSSLSRNRILKNRELMN